MRKETIIAAGVVTAVVVGIFGWLLSSSQSGKTETASETVIELDGVDDPATVFLDQDELPGRPVPEYSDDFVEPQDVTRIIIADPDGDEITELLSEKVIVNDKVVDQDKK